MPSRSFLAQSLIGWDVALNDKFCLVCSHCRTGDHLAARQVIGNVDIVGMRRRGIDLKRERLRGGIGKDQRILEVDIVWRIAIGNIDLNDGCLYKIDYLGYNQAVNFRYI